MKKGYIKVTYETRGKFWQIRPRIRTTIYAAKIVAKTKDTVIVEYSPNLLAGAVYKEIHPGDFLPALEEAKA